MTATLIEHGLSTLAKLRGEGLIRMPTAALYVEEATGIPVSSARLLEAGKHGVKAANGQKVKQETVTFGARLHTSKPAVLRFLAKLNATS